MGGINHDEACLAENHCRDLLRRKRLGLVEVLNLHLWVTISVNDLERPRLDVLLHCGVFKSSTDETPVRGISHYDVLSLIYCTLDSLDIENSVDGVHGGLILRSLADETLFGGERHERWGREATLLVGDCAKAVLADVSIIFTAPSLTDLNAGAFIVGHT